MICVNTIISNVWKYVEHHLWRGMFTIKPAKSSWTCRQPCTKLRFPFCGCNDFVFHDLCDKTCEMFSNIYRSFKYDSLSILSDFSYQIQHRRGSIKEKADKWKCAFQIYYTADDWVNGNASDVGNESTMYVCQRATFEGTDLTRRIDLPLTNDSSDDFFSFCYFRETDLFGMVL